jgi:hypothetical protein
LAELRLERYTDTVGYNYFWLIAAVWKWATEWSSDLLQFNKGKEDLDEGSLGKEGCFGVNLLPSRFCRFTEGFESIRGHQKLVREIIE